MGSTSAAPAADDTRSPVRLVTAASLFDGHDAAINIMRRILQSQGAEVIHLGHDRSVDAIVTAAIQEDADGIAVSSYQGGHNEYFRYMVDELRRRGAGDIAVFAGGGATILPEEIESLQAYGVARIFSPEDGRQHGLQGMITEVMAHCGRRAHGGAVDAPPAIGELAVDAPGVVAQAISHIERGGAGADAYRDELRTATSNKAPVVGFTGTGGSGKSSVVDELVRRLRLRNPELSIGLLLVDPSRRRSGGALLGDRIRMNAVHGDGVYARSLATRQAHRSVSEAVVGGIEVLQAAGFGLILVETAGIGQSDSQIVDLVDLPIYVMTPEYGAASQLEKIDMLELAQLVILNKADRRGAPDALREVRKQWRRNHELFDAADDALPVIATIASRFGDGGMDRVCSAVCARLGAAGFGGLDGEHVQRAAAAERPAMIPAARTRYLAEVAEAVRSYHDGTRAQADLARDTQALTRGAELLGDEPAVLDALRARGDEQRAGIDPALLTDLEAWPETRARYRRDRQTYEVRGREVAADNFVTTLSDNRFPRVATPEGEDWGPLVHYLREENLPGHFPFTAGVFPFKRQGEDPTRMFAGEGGPERTNRRFHLVSHGLPAVRLSTAFDSVTLYGNDPDPRPDIYGKVGNSGVSVCTVDDAKRLYSGFDLCAPSTSVSMTINGPAPVVLAFYLNAAIDQRVEAHLRAAGELDAVRERFADLPTYAGALPEGHDGTGLGLLGIPGDRAVDAETYGRLRAEVLTAVRGTVQADILKEDQAQNTCIFSTDFALGMMADVQRFFIDERVRNFYSVSISGYHIAEAGANPITQLAFTLANGLTYAEYYRARGMDVDDFAPNFSFFFSNGLDVEYNVIGRVARRIWAIAMREVHGASERSQKLKYHVQTSGRSLHAQEMAFNDIRTTLQALTALQDHCNSLHTNAYDEAVTTPTDESVRRALAIQLIIQRELGVGQSENALQGSYLMEELTDLVEEAVLAEFERLSERGGVLGAMETRYQRTKIQDESMLYESKKHSGELPIIGVNTFEGTGGGVERPTEVIRSDEDEKRACLDALRAFHTRWGDESPAALARLQQTVADGGNVFTELMETVKYASLGQICRALFDVGGEYRRAM